MFEVIVFTLCLFISAMMWNDGKINNDTVMLTTIGWVLGSLILLFLKG